MIDTTRIGGAERMAINIANSLAGISNVQSYLIISRNEGVAGSQTCNVVTRFFIGKKSSVDVIAFWKLVTWLRHHGIDILHAHSSSVIWACLCKLIMPKLIVVYHDHLGDRSKAPKGYNKIIRLLSKACNGYIGVTSTGVEWARKNIANSKLQALLLGNYPVVSNWDNDSFNKITLLKGSPTFLLIGNFRKEKNHLLAIRSFAKVLKKLPDAKLWLIGKAIQPQIEKDVVDTINSLSLSGSCINLGEKQNVFPYIAAADIGVFSSTFEGTPVSLLEYGIMGKPVVSTKVGRNAEILGKIDHRLVVESFNDDSFAEAMVIIGENKLMQHKCGQQLKQLVNDEFGEKRIINELLDFYKRLSIND